LAVEKIREITGAAVPVRGDDIDTDRIIPARFLKSITFEGLEQHLFEDDRLQSPGHPLSNPVYASARIMLVNANFGCGSSREHAPQAILRSGIRAVVGQSFSEIFSGNAVAIGLACPTASAGPSLVKTSSTASEFLRSASTQRPARPISFVPTSICAHAGAALMPAK